MASSGVWGALPARMRPSSARMTFPLSTVHSQEPSFLGIRQVVS